MSWFASITLHLFIKFLYFMFGYEVSGLLTSRKNLRYKLKIIGNGKINYRFINAKIPSGIGRLSSNLLSF